MHSYLSLLKVPLLISVVVSNILTFPPRKGPVPPQPQPENIPEQSEKATLWKLMTNKSVIVISLLLMVGSNALR